MLIRQLNAHVFDVFIGSGWNNWTRFEFTSKTLKLINGRPLSREKYQEARKKIEALV